MNVRSHAFVAALGTIYCVQAAVAQGAHPWPDSFVGRLEVLALIEQLNGAILASHSATATLESWCADHRIAVPARITANLDRGTNTPATPADRLALQVSPNEPVGYRHVRLACGGHVLSEADNWYVPSRLTPEMNRQLENTDIPFGKVVESLRAVRQTLAVDRLWSPLPENWDRRARRNVESSGPTSRLPIPAYLFRHRAILFDVSRRPIAEVVETYTSEALNYPR